MRKSSISNRNSNILSNERRSRGRSTDGQRSSLLQPGFATKNRRSSSAENRDSGVGLYQSKKSLPTFQRSRSQLNLQTPRRETISPGPSRTTPNDLAKYGPRSVVGTAQKPQRDTRDFHDKIVLAAAVEQVNIYFAQRDLNIVLSHRQPPSLKTFVDAASFLINEVMPANITSANYVEEIPLAMRLLNYPGSLATSWLKTAYAQHSLSHVVAMLSWLVEFLESSTLPEIFDDATASNDDFRILPAKDYFEFFTKTHAHWNLSESEEPTIDEFKERLAEKYRPGFDENHRVALENEIDALAGKCWNDEEATKQENDLKEAQRALQSDIAKLTAHLKHSHKFCLSLDNKIESLESQKGETEGKIVHIECVNQQLRQQIASQELSVEDLKELVQTCEHLKGRVRSAEKCTSDLQEMAFECDRNIVQLRTKFNKTMENFNNLLVMQSCSIPELSELQIRSIVLAETYVEEAQQVDKALSALYKDSIAARLKIGEALCNTKRQTDEMTLSVDSVRQEVTSLTERTLVQEGRIAKLQGSMQTYEAKIREEESQLKDEINKYVNKEDVATLKEKLAAVLAKQETWEIALEKLKEKASLFFKESVAITESFASEMRIMRTQNEEKLKKLIELKKAQTSKRH